MGIDWRDMLSGQIIGVQGGSTAICSRFIFLEMVDFCIWVHLQIYWSKLFKMKRFGDPNVDLGGVGNPACMVALDVLA